MLSRIADSLFWTNRYMERAENLVRYTMINYILILDKGVNNNQNWMPVLELFSANSPAYLNEIKHDTPTALHELITNTQNINSLKNIVAKARENARGVQDHITKEVWEQVNQLYHYLNQNDLPSNWSNANALEILNILTKEITVFIGVTDATMPRNKGWNFMNIGKYLERALITIEVANSFFKPLEYNVDADTDILYWKPMLLALSGYELHLKTYRGTNITKNALHQIAFNKHFTRSLMYTLIRIEKYLKDIIPVDDTAELTSIKKQFGRLINSIEFADEDKLNKHILQLFLSDTRFAINEFNQKLTQQFFSYT
ncbi:MAG: alpha-E domain-containing protein [Chitinophagaceae bacterium]